MGARLLAIGWTLAILAACTIPGQSIQDLDFWQPDKLFHFLVFLVFAWLWARALTGTLARRLGRTLLIGVCYAILTEVYQEVMPIGRIMDAFDVLANLLGVGVGLALRTTFEAFVPRRSRA